MVLLIQKKKKKFEVIKPYPNLSYLELGRLGSNPSSIIMFP